MQVGFNISDHSQLVSLDAEKGSYKFGYNFQREVRKPASLAVEGNKRVTALGNNV